MKLLENKIDITIGYSDLITKNSMCYNDLIHSFIYDSYIPIYNSMTRKTVLWPEDYRII